MRFKRSLRYRVGLAFALFGGLVSLLLATGLSFAVRDLERHLLDEALTAELQDYMARRQRNPDSLPPAAAGVRGYVVENAGDAAALPVELRGLEAGRYSIDRDGIRYRVAVEQRGVTRFYLLYDQTHIKLRQRYFSWLLAGGAVLMALLSALGGGWLAGRVIAPVTELAGRVRALGPDESGSVLTGDFSQDEVGELARAVEAYRTRLRAFVERERVFTADVSHELRTPLTVIGGAVEVLRADPQLQDAQLVRLARIDRAVHDMTEISGALLILAREERAGGTRAAPCDVAEVLADVVERHRYLLQNKPVELELQVEDHPQLMVERAVLAILLGNLLRNAITHTVQGRIVVRVAQGCVCVHDTGTGITETELPKIFQRYYRGGDSQGAGIGLALVKRICDHYGWTIHAESAPGAGTRIQLSFGQA
ncbi:MAG TPA: HAMP domain-containing sensor histidine kinase [Gammaproteobacteria bacterium]